MSTPHNSAEKGQIAKTVLMPGDPLRSKFIAETFLENPVQFNAVRNMFGYTGTYKGKMISVMGSGMGMPSIGIYSYELFSQYGVENIIRIGSAGAYSPDLKVFDVVLADSAYSESSYAKVQSGYDQDKTYPSETLNQRIKDAAEKLGMPLHIGCIHSSDVFYREGGDVYKRQIEKLPVTGFGVLNKDNELIRNYYIKNKCPIAWYGIEQEDVDYRAVNISFGPQGSSFDIHTREGADIPFKTRLLGEHNIANILAAVAVGRHLGVSWEQLQSAVAQVRYVEHRLEVKKINGYTFIDDAFNSNPVGSAMSLQVLKTMPGTRFIVTPGMIDLGPRQHEINKQFGMKMKDCADEVILVGKRQTEPIVEGLQACGFDMAHVHIVATVKEAFGLVYQKAAYTDTILLENDLPDAFNQ